MKIHINAHSPTYTSGMPINSVKMLFEPVCDFLNICTSEALRLNLNEKALRQHSREIYGTHFITPTRIAKVPQIYLADIKNNSIDFSFLVDVMGFIAPLAPLISDIYALDLEGQLFFVMQKSFELTKKISRLFDTSTPLPTQGIHDIQNTNDIIQIVITDSFNSNALVTQPELLKPMLQQVMPKISKVAEAAIQDNVDKIDLAVQGSDGQMLGEYTLRNESFVNYTMQDKEAIDEDFTWYRGKLHSFNTEKQEGLFRFDAYPNKQFTIKVSESTNINITDCITALLPDRKVSIFARRVMNCNSLGEVTVKSVIVDNMKLE